MSWNTGRNYHLLLQHDLQIVQEINLFVHYCLPGVSKGEVRKVISHPLALAHCGQALSQLGVDLQAVEDTAGVVEMLLSQKLFDTAAIAHPRAAHLYGLHVLSHGLQDDSWNVTRFVVLSKHYDQLPRNHQPGIKLKTSMVIGHYGGSLALLLRVLSAFSSHSIIFRKLEMNDPSLEGGEPVMILDKHGSGSLKAFPRALYVDFEGSVWDQKAKAAIAEIRDPSLLIWILGSYEADTNIYDLQ